MESKTPQDRVPAAVARPARDMAKAAAVCSVLIGLTMIVAALAKMAAPTAFLETVKVYKLLPERWALLAATGLVGGELALGVLLVTGLFRRTAAWLNLLLLVGFSGVLLYAMKAGIKDCGCFGKMLEATPQVSLVKNLVLLALNAVVLARGRDLSLQPAALRHGLAWGALCLGAAGFLAGSPASKVESAGTITLDQLAMLRQADPPVELPREGLIFLFGADCTHCWAYAGAVDLITRRMPALPVTAVTYSSPEELDDFRAAYGPTYPIHWLTESLFRTVAPVIPAAIWLRDGQVEQAWSGEVPSHRELAQLGGYEIAAAPATQPAAIPAAAAAPKAALTESAPADSHAAASQPPAATNPPGAVGRFGGTVRARSN